MTTSPEEVAEFVAAADRLNDPAAPVPFECAVRWWNLGWIDMAQRVAGREVWFITALGRQLVCAQTEEQKAAAIVAADEAVRKWLRSSQASPDGEGEPPLPG